MQNYKMIIAYDGTRYSGWQRQGNTRNTIQGKLEQALSTLVKESVEISGSGRTDAGVHAAGQVASFHIDASLPCNSLCTALNKSLPEDIAVLSLSKAQPRFHARLSAKEKTYCYTINMAAAPDVFSRRFEYHLAQELDIEIMRKTAELLLGTHDYRGFSTGRSKKSTTRTITEIRVEEVGTKLKLTYTGDGFLYNMVRILTGTLIECGLGKREPDSVLNVFQSNNRELAGFTAPPQGLCLVHVNY